MQLSAKGHCPRPVTPPLYPPTIPQLPPASTTHRDGEICKNLADREGKTRDEESALSSIQLTKPKNHTSCPNGPRQSQLTKHQLQLTKPVGEKIPGFSRYTQNPYLNTRGTLHRSVLLGYKENQQKVQWTGKATSRHTIQSLERLRLVLGRGPLLDGCQGGRRGCCVAPHALRAGSAELQSVSAPVAISATPEATTWPFAMTCALERQAPRWP